MTSHFISHMTSHTTSHHITSHQITSHHITWWRHQMETFSALLAFCAGNSSVTGEFPSQRPVTRSFDVFFEFSLNKRLSKESWGWWSETSLHSLWRHCNDIRSHGTTYHNTSLEWLFWAVHFDKWTWVVKHLVAHQYTSLVPHLIGPPSHWFPISLAPHLIGPPSHWSPN